MRSPFRLRRRYPPTDIMPMGGERDGCHSPRYSGRKSG